MKDAWRAQDDALRKLNGFVRSKKFYRCGNCAARNSMRKELWQFVKVPACSCGSRNWRLDMFRYKEWKNRTGVYDTCFCGGSRGEVWWPHRKGSHIDCLHFLENTKLTKQEIYERYGSAALERLYGDCNID